MHENQEPIDESDTRKTKPCAPVEHGEAGCDFAALLQAEFVGEDKAVRRPPSRQRVPIPLEWRLQPSNKLMK